jgi:cytochrome c biogenesis protein CcdA
VTVGTLAENVSRLLSSGSIVAVPAVLAVGFFSTLRNPCAVPLYPAASNACVAAGASAVAANLSSPAGPQRTSFLNATAFVMGLAISIACLGMVAASAGRVVGIGIWGRYAIALLPVLMGMQRMGWINIPFLQFKITKTFRPGVGGAFSTGFLLSLVVGRCGTTVLASILAYAFYHQALVYGGVLLFSYGIGAGIPLITFGTIVAKVTGWIDRIGFPNWTEYVMGGMMMSLGFYMLWMA